MSKQLTVDGTIYNYPENRDPAGWGEEATAWAEAVTDVLSNFSGPGDIAQTVATIQNDSLGAFLPISGLFFDPVVVRGAIVEYATYRVTTGGGAMEKAEIGTMYLIYKSTAATWDFARVGAGGPDLDFDITTAGQVRYKSTPLTGTGYSGTIKFRARALTI